MSAPTATSNGALADTGPDREPLEDKLRKLLPKPIKDENKEALEKIAAGVRAREDAECARKKADEEILSGLTILDPDLRSMHNVCDAHRVIGKELRRADGQPVRRIVKPPMKKTDAPIQEEPADDLGPSGICTAESVQYPSKHPRPKSGRKVVWDMDRPDKDSFIRRTVEEAGEFLPHRGGEADPKAVDLVLKMMERLHVSANALAEASR